MECAVTRGRPGHRALAEAVSRAGSSAHEKTRTFWYGSAWLIAAEVTLLLVLLCSVGGVWSISVSHNRLLVG